MDSPYERLPDETRQDWCDLMATEAFIATVREAYEQARENLVLTAMSGGVDEGSFRFAGGVLQAYRFVLDLPTRGMR